MPRRPRVAPGGLVHHVFNRAAGRMKLFSRDKDFLAFAKLLVEAQQRHPIRILSYCLLNDRWHFVVWPRKDGEVTAFFRWLSHTHAMRWRAAHRSAGIGPLYGARFRSFVVQQDGHLLATCRYVEQGPVSAGLVRQAQDWKWSSLFARENGSDELRSILSEWPVARPKNWQQLVNRPLATAEAEAIQLSIKRCRPFGDQKWLARTVGRLHLEHTVRREGRPSRAESKRT